MKNKVTLPLFCVLLMFVACSKDDDGESPSTPEFNESLLFNKWWYSTTGSTEFYISSTGTFQQKLSESLSDSGTWEWINASHTKMKFSVTPGGANIVNAFWIEYTEIEASTMKYKYSTDNEEYSPYSFTDSE